MNKICLIIPFFGTFPAWINVFLMSCRKNVTIDFHIITDVQREEKEASNIFFHYITFKEIQRKVWDAFQGVLPNAYKLCDYRPCYGILFKELLERYDYWGHCDLDMVMGDVRFFLDKIHYEQYDRLFLHGPFVLYRNSKLVNSLFMRPLPKNLPPMMHFKNVRRTSYPMHYDEVGMNLLCSYYNLSFYKEDVGFDVSYYFIPFRMSCLPLDVQCLSVYKHGKIITYTLKQGQMSSFESMYLHFQKRQMQHMEEESDLFAITEKGFIPLTSDVSPEVIQQLVPSFTEQLPVPFFEQKRSKIKKLLRVLRNEIPVRGLMSFGTLWNIAQNNRWIYKQGGDYLYTKSPWFNGSIRHGEK